MLNLDLHFGTMDEVHNVKDQGNVECKTDEGTITSRYVQVGYGMTRNEY
jgi:hypothetical protein